MTLSSIGNTLEAFSTIYARACERKGGPVALAQLLPASPIQSDLALLSDAEYLSAFSRQVFKSGFVWRVVTHKWPQYEQAFFGFELFKVAMMSPDQLAERACDPALIRHQKKTQAIYDNAIMVMETSAQWGGFGQFISEWPSEDVTGLWLWLKQHGTRLGGNTGPYALRALGKDTFLATRDVLGYFQAHGLLDAAITSKKGLSQMQAVFNEWQQQSGYSLAHLSMIVAMSVGDNHLAAQ
ncbi:MAG: DNA-3-methyladenine glycosylase I [Shewanella sp.]